MNTYFIRYTFGLYREFYKVTQQRSIILELHHEELNIDGIKEEILEYLKKWFVAAGTRTEEQCLEMFVGDIITINKLS